MNRQLLTNRVESGAGCALGKIDPMTSPQPFLDAAGERMVKAYMELVRVAAEGPLVVTVAQERYSHEGRRFNRVLRTFGYSGQLVSIGFNGEERFVDPPKRPT